MNAVPPVRVVAAGIAVVVPLLAIGYLVPSTSWLALAAAGLILVVGISAHQPALIPVLAMPGLLVVERAGGGVLDLSVSDLVLFAAFWVALFFAPRPFSPPMRALLWLSVVYQAATLFTVIANPYQANTVEWFHAWLSVAGALVVGWAVGRAGCGRLGLTLMTVPCIGIALLTCATALRQLAEGNSGPVYLEWPFAMHKNLIGAVLAFAALVVYARPHWLGWPRALTWPAFVLLTTGAFATQARQALLGLAIGLMVYSLRSIPGRRRIPWIWLLALPAVYFVWTAVQEQLRSGDPHNSAQQRLSWYGDAMEVWERSPWVGQGLRWWTSGRTEFVFQPPNAEIEVLSSAGIIGLVGFVVLFIGALVVLWRVDPRYGTLAFCMVLMRLVQGQFDLFWSAIVISVPFAVVGVCLGAEAFDRDRAAPSDSALHSRRTWSDRPVTAIPPSSRVLDEPVVTG